MFAQPFVQDLLLKLTNVTPDTTLPDSTKLKRPKEMSLMNRQQLEKVLPFPPLESLPVGSMRL